MVKLVASLIFSRLHYCNALLAWHLAPYLDHYLISAFRTQRNVSLLSSVHVIV